MARGYWVANVAVENLDEYLKYTRANGVAFAKYGGRFLVRGGRHEVPEGTMGERIVVIEFPDYQSALDCYHSEEYRNAMKLREGHARANLAIVEGWEG